MKLANLALTLLCGAVITAAPAVARAGHGLLDGGCGCASQKGPNVVQKRPVFTSHVFQKDGVSQKGSVFQKGGVAQKGGAAQKCSDCASAWQKGASQKGDIVQKGSVFQKGGVAQKGGKGGGCCNLCIPNPLPAMARGIDCLLGKIFCCHCQGASCGSCGGKFAGKGGGYEASAYGDYEVIPDAPEEPVPANPFIDDLEAPPMVEPPASARIRRSSATLHSADTAEPNRSTSISMTGRKPRLLPAADDAKPAPVLHVSAQTASGLRIPANPLRSK